LTQGIDLKSGLVVGVLLAIVSTTAWPAPLSFAHDHEVPGAALLTGPYVQSGREGSGEWISRTRTECLAAEQLAVYSWPRALPVVRGRRTVTIRFAKVQRPLKVAIGAWTAIDRNSRPVGRSSRVRFVLRSERRNNRLVAWRAVFPLEIWGQRYIEVFAQWRDQEGCFSLQDQSWTFRLRGLS
jgi:hypothetical protein